MDGIPELPGVNTNKASGRKDSTGTEEPIKLKPIKDGVRDAMKLYVKLESAKADYNQFMKGLSERSNVNSTTLKKLISSSHKGKFVDTQRLIEQQQEIFDAVGEVPSGAVSALN